MDSAEMKASKFLMGEFGVINAGALHGLTAVFDQHVAEQREDMHELKEALYFFDKVNASAVERTTVGRDHWDWLLSAARKVVEKSDEHK